MPSPPLAPCRRSLPPLLLYLACFDILGNIHRPEENLSRVEKDFETLSRALRKTTAPTTVPGLLSACRLSEEFREAFLSGTYYDTIYLSETVGSLRLICSFQTDPEEEFDEYSRPYIYLYILSD